MTVGSLLSLLGSLLGVLGAYIVAIPDLPQSHRLRFYKNSSRLQTLFATREEIKAKDLGKKYELFDEYVCKTHLDHLYIKGDISNNLAVPDSIVQQIDQVILKYDSKENKTIDTVGLAKTELVEVFDKTLRRRCRTIGIEVALLGIVMIFIGNFLPNISFSPVLIAFLTGVVVFLLISPPNTGTDNITRQQPSEQDSEFLSNNIGNSLIKLASIIAGMYVYLLVTNILLRSLPKEGDARLLLSFLIQMVAVSGTLVYARRFVNTLESASKLIWEEVTVEGKEGPRFFPKIDNALEILLPADYTESIEISLKKTIVVAFIWIAIAICFQYALFDKLVSEMNRGGFVEIVSTYEPNKNFLIGLLAILGPLFAVFGLVLQNITTDSGSTVVILTLIGLPALLATPGTRNLIAFLEIGYSRIAIWLSNKIPSESDAKTKEAISHLILVFLIIISYGGFYLVF